MSLAVSRGTVTYPGAYFNATGAIGACTAQGGTAPYIYSWSSSAGATAIATPADGTAKSSLRIGQYTLVVKDATQAQVSEVFDLSYSNTLANPAVNATSSVTNQYTGASCATDGMYMALGAPGATTTFAGDGAVVISRGYSNVGSGVVLTITSTQKAVGAGFGTSVALNGSTLVIGQPGGTSQKAYVGTLAADAWTQKAVLSPSVAAPSFGCSVAVLDATTVVVGASGYNSSAGAVFVFSLSGAVWSQTAMLLPSDPQAGALFGASVSLDITAAGVNIAVGAPGWSSSTGAAYSFYISGGVWSQISKLLCPTQTVGDQFGFSVAVDAGTLVVGAPMYSQKLPVSTNSGAAFIYTTTGQSVGWQLTKTVQTGVASDQVGASVALLQTRLCIGAPGRTSGTGAVLLASKSTGTWLVTSLLTTATAPAPSLGKSVAVSLYWLVLGAPNMRASAITNGGGVFYLYMIPSITRGTVYHCTTSISGNGGVVSPSGNDGINPYSFVWSALSANSTAISGSTTLTQSVLEPGKYGLQITDAMGSQYTEYFDIGISYSFSAATVTNYTPANYAFQGVSVAVDTGTSGTLMAFGAYGAASNVGAVYVYSRDSSTANTSSWSYLRTLDNPSATPNDYFGYLVLVSGTYVIVANSNPTVANRKVVIFNGASVASTITNTTSQSGFAGCIACNSSCTVLAVGTSGGGPVFIYTLTSNSATLTQTIPGSSAINFGSTLSIDGSYLAIGANSAPTPNAFGPYGGCVYIYTLSGSWVQQSILYPVETFPQSFGSSVALNGNNLLVGTGNNLSYLYTLSGSVWQPVTKLTSDVTGGSSQVALSSSAAIIGNVGGAGVAKLYRVAEGTLLLGSVETSTLQPTTGNQLGFTVSVSDRYAATGLYAATVAAFQQSGAVIPSLAKDTALYGRTTDILIAGQNTGAVSASAVGGLGTYVYSWASQTAFEGTMVTNVSANTGLALSALTPGSYTLTAVQSSAGTTLSKTFLVKQFSITPTMGPSTSGTVFSATVFGGSGTYTVAWTTSGPNATPITVQNLSSKTLTGFGIYSVAVTDTVYPSSTCTYTFDGCGIPLSMSVIEGAANASQLFGSAISAFGSMVLVGASGNNNASINVRASGAPTSTFTSTALNSTFLGDYGYATALTADTAVVTAPAINSVRVGTASAFFLSNGVWSPTNTPTAFSGPDTVAADHFGKSVSVANNVMAIGAHTWANKSPVVAGAGTVYIYTRASAGGAWSYLQSLVAPDQMVNAQFGSSVSLVAGGLLVGAPGWGLNSAGFGACYYFTQAGDGSWSYHSTIPPFSDRMPGDNFGSSIALDETSPRAAICRPGIRVVYIMRLDAGTGWALERTFRASTGTGATGLGCAMSNGALGISQGTQAAAVVLARSGTTWSVLNSLTTYSGSNGTIALSDKYLYAGVTTYSVLASNAGAVSTAAYNPITVSSSIGHIYVPNQASGSIYTVPTGGTAPYTVTWTSFSSYYPAVAATSVQGQTGFSLSGLTAGAYTQALTDASGQTLTSTFTVTQLSIKAGAVALNTPGTIQPSTVSGGSGSYSVSWSSSPGATSMTGNTSLATQSSLSAGLYYLTVRDTVYTQAVVRQVFEVLPLATGTTITNPLTGSGNGHFGDLISISGTYMAVSGPYATNLSSQTLAGSFTVYQNFVKVATVFGTAFNQFFGSAIAIDADTVCTTDNTSSIYWYLRSGSVFNLQTKLTASPAAFAVAVQGDLSVALKANTVYFYSRTAAVWTQQQSLTATSCNCVSMDGSWVAVGAAVTISTSKEAVYMYLRDGNGVWAYNSTLTAPDSKVGDQFGYSVSMKNGLLAVAAASYKDRITNTVVGAVYLFSLANGTWTCTTLLKPLYSNNSQRQFVSLTAKGQLYTGGQQIGSGSLYTPTSDNSRWFKVQEVGYSDGGCAATDTSIAYGGASTASGFGNCLYLTATSASLTIVPGSVSPGSISITRVYGGTAPYTVAWTGLSSTNLLAKSNLAVGNYTVTVTDAVSASVNFTYTVTAAAILGPQIIPGTVTHVAVFGQATGSISLSSYNLSTGPYTIAWTSSSGASAVSNPTVVEPKSNLLAGTYTLSVTDANSIQATYAYVVLQPIAITGGAITPVAVTGQSTGAIAAITAVGGNGVYTYAWSSSNGGSTITTQNATAKTGLLAGTYTVVVTDTASYSTTRVFNVLTPITITGGAVTNVAVTGQTTGAISAVTAAGGNGVLSYAWSTTASTPITTQDGSAKSGLGAGVYTLVVSDTTSYSATRTFRVATTISITAGTVTPVSAFGGSDGSIAATTVTQGSGTFASYVWTSSGGGSAISSQDLSTKSGLTAGVYTLVVTDDTGTTATQVYTVLQPLSAITGGAVTNATPYGSSNGAIAAVSVQGGNGVYSYAWTSTATAVSQNASAKSGLAAGTYTVTASDVTGYTSSRTFTVLQPIVVNGGALTPAAMYGDSTGAITALTPAGGNGVYSYAWTSTGTAITTQDATAKTSLSAGTYTVVVTDTASYSTTKVFTVLQPIVITGGAITPVGVYGASTGSIAAITPAGGNGVYSYAWTSSGGGSTITTQNATAKTGLLAGTYTVVVTDTASYSTTTVFTVLQPIAITGGAVTNVAISGDTTGAIAAVTAAGGNGVYSYAWSTTASTPITTQDSSAKSGLAAGVYTLVVSDTASYSTTRIFTVGTVINVTAGTVTPVSAFGGSDGSISNTTITGGSGTFVSYVWTSSGGGSAIASQDLSAKSGLTAGVYTLVITDDMGTTATQVYTVLQPLSAITGGAVTNATPYGSSSGAIAAVSVQGGNGVYSYAWTSTATAVSQNASAKSGLAAGTYTVTASDATGYTSSRTFTILQPIAVLGGALTPVSVYGGSTGAIAALTPAGGNGVYSYAWTSTGTTITTQDATAKTSLSAGTYTVVVTDTASYSTTKVFTVLQPIVINGGAITPVGVYGASTGSIAALTPAGGNGVYSYAWTSTGTPISTQNATAKTSLSAGTYTVVVTDTAAFSTTRVFTVLQPISVLGGALTHVSVYGASTGAIAALTPAGGNGVYSYAWTSTGTTITTQDATAKTNLSAGAYTVVVTDTAANSTTKVFTILQPIVVTAAGAVTNASSYGTSTGSIGATTVAGGNGVYTYAWVSTNGGTTIAAQTLAAKTSLAAGTYTLTITDTASYSKTQVYTVLQPISVLGGALTPVSVYGASTGAIAAITPAGGNGVYSYAWTSTGTTITTQDATAKTNLSAGAYTVVVTDTASFSTTKVFTILQPIVVTAAGAVTNASTYTSATGSIGATTVAGGNGVYTYAWVSTNGGSAISPQDLSAHNNLTAGTYTLTITDTASYSKTQVYTVLQPISVLGGALTPVSVYGGSTGAIAAITPAGGNGVYSYAWTSTGTTITTQDATAKTNLSAGAYTVVVTDTASFSTTKVFTVLQPIVVTAAGAVTNVSSYGSATGSIGATTVAGGNGVYTYAWVSTNGGSAISPQDLSAHNSLTAGTYTLTITDTASYSTTQVYTILQPIQITAGAVTAVSTFGANNGSIAATTVAGGNGVYTYTWTIT